jgi:serine/threonine-protein kinase
VPPVVSIGRYRVERLIGNGGFAAVYEARDPDGRRVAIKRLHGELALRSHDILRFDREIRIIRGLRHPNVVEILDVGDDQAPYFVMELLHGTDLSDHIARRGRLSLEETVEILAPVCSALSAAHQKGIVHRDLKASNVFLDRERVVLLDFGVAKLLDGTALRLTRSHLIVGSPACMAPEQILNGPVDERTDVYGLGVLAYQMLTGALPFNRRPTSARCIWSRRRRRSPGGPRSARRSIGSCPAP